MAVWSGVGIVLGGSMYLSSPYLLCPSPYTYGCYSSYSWGKCVPSLQGVGVFQGNVIFEWVMFDCIKEDLLLWEFDRLSGASMTAVGPGVVKTS